MKNKGKEFRREFFSIHLHAIVSAFGSDLCFFVRSSVVERLVAKLNKNF